MSLAQHNIQTSLQMSKALTALDCEIVFCFGLNKEKKPIAVINSTYNLKPDEMIEIIEHHLNTLKTFPDRIKSVDKKPL